MRGYRNTALNERVIGLFLPTRNLFILTTIKYYLYYMGLNHIKTTYTHLLLRPDN